ncbi:HEPN domain-containing protein [Thermochromatium tepidum]|nr:HEPN domain-containing protein [Thermochromatium tepidum]
MNSPLELAQGLLSRARDDAFVVRRLMADAAVPAWVLGFHAQQAVEKALKAVLSATGVAYPRTHNLVMLVELLRATCALPPDADEFGRLTPFGVVMRYEDVAVDTPPLDATWLDAIVSRTIEWAQRFLTENEG